MQFFDQIIARKWWDVQVKNYPYFVTTEPMLELYPQNINEDFKESFNEIPDYVTTGLVNGGRVWGFKTFKDRRNFIAVLEATGMNAIDIVGENHGSLS